MRIFYARKPDCLEDLATEDPILVFVPDNYRTTFSYYWDDFGYKTTCSVYTWDDDKRIYLGEVKLLLEGETNTHKKMRELCGAGDYVEFSKLTIEYLTVPESREFYTKISKCFSSNLNDYFVMAKDAAYVSLFEHNDLIKSEGYRESLLREPGARKAFSHAKTELGYSEYQDIKFNVAYQLDAFSKKHKVEFDFSDGFYPSNINLVIGPNGVGKTQCVSKLMRELTGVDRRTRKRRKRTSSAPLYPFFSNIICFSYSPFEDVSNFVTKTNIRTSSVFKSFGFYDKGEFDREKPVRDSVECLFEIVRQDVEDNWFSSLPTRVESLKDILGMGIQGFDDIGVYVSQKNRGKRLIKLGSDLERFLKFKERVQDIEGVVFIQDGEALKLSSGQRMFSHLVLGALSHIKEETLLIFDEPELYLHPSLEIVLVRMLRELLERYGSYAVIATHSLVISREVPQRCTNVIKREDDIPLIERPPFETFGASMDRINSYVFGDEIGVKRYQEFFDKVYSRHEGIERILEVAQEEINPEGLLYLMSKE